MTAKEAATYINLFRLVSLSIFTIWMSPLLISEVSGEYFHFFCILHRFGWLVVLLFYVHGKHLRSCRDGQLA